MINLKELIFNRTLVISFNNCKIIIDKYGNLFVRPKNLILNPEQVLFQNCSPETTAELLTILQEEDEELRNKKYLDYINELVRQNRESQMKKEKGNVTVR